MSVKYHVLPLLLGALVGCGQKQPSSRESIPWIRIARPELQNQIEGYPLSGTVVPEGTPQTLSFLVAGRVLAVHFREGEPVRQGQVLATLESTSYTAALEAAAAQTRSAQAAANRAEDEHRRMKLLYERQSLAENDYLKFKLAEQAAREQFLQAQANEKAVRKNMTDCVLRAPNSGVITRRMLEPGLAVASGQPVFEMAQMRAVEIQVGIPENLIQSLHVGQSAQITLPALPNQTFSGNLRIINAAADPASRTYMARIAVKQGNTGLQQGSALRLGMVAEARIQSGQKTTALMVPYDAVIKDPQGVPQVFEYLPSEGRVIARRVDLGGLDGQRVQIRSGIDPSRWIVIAGQHGLRDGNPVQVEPAGASAR